MSGEAATKALSPFVLWAQTQTAVVLRVELRDASNPDFTCTDQSVRLAARGVGARGDNHYIFALDLYSKIDVKSEQTSCQVYDSKIEISLLKAQPAWWPRLTLQLQKPVWLKVDFDRWKSEDDGLEESEEEKRDIMNDYPGMYDKLHKEELGYRKEDVRKVYLIIYNTFQFIGFLYISCVMSVRYFKYGVDSMEGAYENVGAALRFLQLMQFLEVMHPLFGYTKGSPVTPLLQITGRAIILFAMIEGEPRMQTKPVVFYLIWLWISIEIVRYPYYITQLYKRDIYLLTWLRYTLWIPLYPLGILCEGIIVLRNIPYFEETQRFSLSLPNMFNFAFHMPTAMRLYLLFLFIPGLYSMMIHMYKMRVSKLATYKRVIIKKSR